MSRPVGLSKSRITLFEQCPKRLWLSVHRPELAEESAGVRAGFADGHRVGDLACSLYPEGAMISAELGLGKAVDDTAALLATGASSLTNFIFNNNNVNRPNTSTTSGLAISTSGTAWTGQCNDNRIWGLDNSAQIWIDTGTKLAFNQNFCPITAAADKSGLINPAAV